MRRSASSTSPASSSLGTRSPRRWQHHPSAASDCCTPTASQAWYHQGAAGFPRNGKFLSPFCRRCCPHPQAAHGRSAWRAAPLFGGRLVQLHGSGVPGGQGSSRRATQLAHPCPKSQLSLAVDASEDHVGAVLQQRALPSSTWCPLGFFSQKLDPAQVKYSAFDRELFACVAAIRHFRYMV